MHWYALLVKPQHEKSVHRQLSSLGRESFLPLYRAHRRAAGRIRESDLPLFPGFVFCRFSLHERRALYDVPGVLALVAAGHEAAVIPTEEIEAIRAAIRAGVPLRPWPYKEQTEKMTVAGGPLRGARGAVIKVRKTRQLVLSVEALRRALIAGLDAPAGEGTQAPRHFGAHAAQIACG